MAHISAEGTTKSGDRRGTSLDDENILHSVREGSPESNQESNKSESNSNKRVIELVADSQAISNYSSGKKDEQTELGRNDGNICDSGLLSQPVSPSTSRK